MGPKTALVGVILQSGGEGCSGFSQRCFAAESRLRSPTVIEIVRLVKFQGKIRLGAARLCRNPA